MGDSARKQAEGGAEGCGVGQNWEKVNRTPWRTEELGRGAHRTRGGDPDPGKGGHWNNGGGTGLELGERVGSPAPASRAGSPGRRAGGVPRGRGAAPARRRHRPLPDSRPPRVHSDFSAHFSSSPVTPALALPPPAAPPRSASRGNPRRSQPRGRSRALRRSAPPRPGPLSSHRNHVFQACHPQIGDPRKWTVSLNIHRRGPALGATLGGGNPRASNQVFSTSGPAQIPQKEASRYPQPGMRTPTLLQKFPCRLKTRRIRPLP